MSFVKKILFLVSVPKCVNCGERLSFDEDCLCVSCKGEYEEQKARGCSRCAKPLPSCTCSNQYLKAHSVRSLIKVYRYSREPEFSAGNHLIYSLKQDNRRDVKRFLFEELSESLTRVINMDRINEYIITNVPRRRAGIVRYGYDHSRDLAKLVAKKLNVEYKSILKSLSASAQKKAVGTERLKNAKFDYSVGKKYTLKGKRVILIDDVVTTGASMGNCSILLKGLGAKEIIGASLAIAYKDNV